jgi:hypothetical protein
MTQIPDPLLSRLAAMASRRGPKSKLAVWMRANRGHYEALLAERGPAWEADATVFVASGLLSKPEGYDAEGPEGDATRRRVVNTVKQTWHRIRVGKTGRGVRTARAKPTVAQPEPPNAAPPIPDPGAGQRRLDVFLQELKERSR